LNGKTLFNKIIHKLLIIVNDGGTESPGIGFCYVIGQIYQALRLRNNACSFILLEKIASF